MLRPERQQHRVVAGRCLELEVERQAELLAQRQPQRSVDAGAQRGVDDQLHAAAGVKEALEHDVLVCRQHAPQRGSTGAQVVDDQARRHVVYTRLLLDERDGGVSPSRIQPPCDGAAQPGDLLGQLVGASGRLAQPERYCRVPAGGIAHPHDTVGHLRDLPRMAPQQEDVALHRLDRKVLVDGPDEAVTGLHQHAVVAGLGDRSARCQGRQPSSATAAQAPVDAVAMQVGHAPAASCLDADRDQLDDLLELLPREPPVGPGAGELR